MSFHYVCYHCIDLQNGPTFKKGDIRIRKTVWVQEDSWSVLHYAFRTHCPKMNLLAYRNELSLFIISGIKQTSFWDMAWIQTLCKNLLALQGDFFKTQFFPKKNCLKGKCAILKGTLRELFCKLSQYCKMARLYCACLAITIYHS